MVKGKMSKTSKPLKKGTHKGKIAKSKVNKMKKMFRQVRIAKRIKKTGA